MTAGHFWPIRGGILATAKGYFMAPSCRIIVAVSK